MKADPLTTLAAAATDLISLHQKITGQLADMQEQHAKLVAAAGPVLDLCDDVWDTLEDSRVINEQNRLSIEALRTALEAEE